MRIFIACMLFSLFAQAQDPFNANARLQNSNVEHSNNISQCHQQAISEIENLKFIGLISYAEHKQTLFLTENQQLLFIQLGDKLPSLSLQLQKIEQNFLLLNDESCPLPIIFRF